MLTLLFRPDGGRHSSAVDVYPCHGHGQTEHGEAIPGDTFANGQTQWALQNADLPCFGVCRIWEFVLLWEIFHQVGFIHG